MNQGKRMMVLLLALVLTVGMLAPAAHARTLLPKEILDRLPTGFQTDALQPMTEDVEAPKAGTCGDNLTWVLDGNHMTISGTGPMDDYSVSNPAPWAASSSMILDITMEEGVTSIGKFAFADLPRLMKVEISQTVTAVGSSAVSGSSGNLYFLGDAPAFADDAFQGFDGICYYLRHWDRAVLKRYNGNVTWHQGQIDLSPDNQQLYAVNEPIVAEDLKFGYTVSYDSYPYSPGTVTIGDYDNSTEGKKTVKVTVDGWTLDYEYDVTDGQSHLENITVAFDRIQTYTFGSITPEIVVKADGKVLSDADYRKHFQNNVGVGTDASVTITGLKTYAGFEKTYPFAIVKADLSDAVVEVEDVVFYGIPMEPEVRVYHNDWLLTRDEDYVVFYENNTNEGTGTVRIVGIGNYEGTTTQTFQIAREDTDMFLRGAYNGSQLDGVYNDDYYYQEGLMSPGVFTGHIDSPYPHVAIYQLFRVTEDGEELVAEHETEYGVWSYTGFTYDFSHVYNSKSPDGGEVYLLMYSWVDSNYDVFTGACVMYISAKVDAASSMSMMQVTEDGDFRREYLAVAGEDGVLDQVQWSSSNESVATVSNGVVTMVSPGTATITAKSGSLTASCTVTAQPQNLADAVMFDADACVIYNGTILKNGKDYGCTITNLDGIKEVTATGMGLFTGQILRQFDGVTGEALGHTHTFDSRYGTDCNHCDFAREVKEDSDSTLGDLNGDAKVNEDDAIYLLQYVLLPEFFPVYQDVDYNNDDKVNEDDAIYLLQHVLLPEFFPL